ncbi:MAG: hypothetical protein WBG85_10115 [Rhodanobacter sp.]
MKPSVLLVVVIAFSVSGCAMFHSPATRKELASKQSYWMSYDATRRGALIIADQTKVKTCTEPAPDVALSFANALKGDLKLPGGTSATGVDASFNATALALAGRDNVVLLAREALFRICEASMNGSINQNDVRPLFEKVFEEVAAIAEAQANKAKRNAEIEKLRLQQLQLQQVQ